LVNKKNNNLKLEKMIIETKFDIGDDVWVMLNNRPFNNLISLVSPGIRIKEAAYRDSYRIEKSEISFYDTDIFRTKEELLNSL
jgi:hypothetical protein